MIDPDSRYAALPIDIHRTPEGREIRFVRHRPLPDPASMRALGEVVVQDKDRLDLVAARAYGSASAWWRVADANETLDPHALVETPGRRLKIPSPI